jgi:hypothetical protein
MLLQGQAACHAVTTLAGLPAGRNSSFMFESDFLRGTAQIRPGVGVQAREAGLNSNNNEKELSDLPQRTFRA